MAYTVYSVRYEEVDVPVSARDDRRADQARQRLVEFLNEGDDVVRRLDVSVGGERRVAFAVTTEVRTCHPVALLTQGGGEKTVRTPQIAHTGYQHDQRTIAADVVADPAFRAIEE